MAQLQLAGRGAGEELGVLGHRAGPAALDEAHPELVEQPRHGQLVADRVRDALTLGPVAQGRVEDVECVAVHGAPPTENPLARRRRGSARCVCVRRQRACR